jgi:hypothetical protein
MVASVRVPSGNLPGELGRLREMLPGVPAAAAYRSRRDLVVEFVNDEFLELVGGRDVTGLPVRAALPGRAGPGSSPWAAARSGPLSPRLTSR